MTARKWSNANNWTPDERRAYLASKPVGSGASLRLAISAALARPGAPTQAALARAAGIAPENLSAWLKGRRKSLPQAKIEAMIVQLDLVIVPRS